MRNNKTRQVALSGLLFALAMALSFMESAITPLLGLIPGVKIGLANIVVMYALFFMGFPQALTLTVLKAFFVGLTRGATAGLLSLSGGLVSVLVMWLLYKLPRRPTYFILSVCGALGHNIGQLIASFLLSSALALTYAPIMFICGLGMGLVTSSCLAALLPALGKMGFSTQPRDQRKNS